MRHLQRRATAHQGYPAGARSGFTLLELLITMVILLILTTLLLGAVILVRGQVSRAQQVAELSQLDIALNSFKQKYGIFPPSRIRLRTYIPSGVESFYELTNAFDAHSVSYLRRIWPSIKLPITNNGAQVETPTSSLIWYVDNSSPGFTPNQYYDLEGDQCLVFFLGGIAERRGTSSFILHGFTDDQTNPSRIADSSTPQTLSRVPSFYPFDVGRLYLRADPQYASASLVDIYQRSAEESSATGSYTDFFGHGTTPGASSPYLGQLPSYEIIGADPNRPLPIAYFSAYEGRGYRPDDLNIPDPLSVGTISDEIYFQLVWPGLTKASDDQNSPSPLSIEPNPYTRNSASQGSSSIILRSPTTIIQCYNPQSYQLILPGADGEFGAGGSQSDYTLSITGSTNQNPGGGWSENQDNIANFTGGIPVGDFVTQQQK